MHIALQPLNKLCSREFGRPLTHNVLFVTGVFMSRRMHPLPQGLVSIHDDVIKWKHFPRYWPFVRGIDRSRWIPRTKASDAELWFFFICARINDWVNNREAGYLRRHRGHYDVNVMFMAVWVRVPRVTCVVVNIAESCKVYQTKIDKSHNTPVPYPAMQHSEQKYTYQSRHASRHVRHARAVMHVRIDMYIYVLNDALRDKGQVHCGICEIGPF